MEVASNKTELHSIIKKLNINIGYDLKSNLHNFDLTFKNCLPGAVTLTKSSDIEKYEYAGYGIGFNSKRTFPHSNGGTGVNVVVFGADMSSSARANNNNNRRKSILIPGEGFAQGLEETTLYAEKMHSVNFTATKKKICLSLH